MSLLLHSVSFTLSNTSATSTYFLSQVSFIASFPAAQNPISILHSGEQIKHAAREIWSQSGVYRVG